MRRKRYNKGDILIDLTSLLDVIFIILLIVVCNQQNVTREVEVQQAEAAELAQQAEVQLQLYTDQMESASDFCLVSVNARYEADNVTVRHVFIQKKGEEIEEIDLIGNNTKESLEQIKSVLQEYVDVNAGKPIIFSLNERDEHILYRDEKAIQDIFNQLREYSEDVYIK